MPGLPIYPAGENAAAYERLLREVFLDPILRSFSQGLADTASARELLRKLEDESYTPVLPDGVPEDQVRDSLRRMEGYHGNKLIQTFREGFGVDVTEVVRDRGEVESFMRLAVRRNIELIRTIPTHLHDDLIRRFEEQIDKGGFIDEQQTREMVARVGHVGGYTLRRIVRDQNSKVTGQLTHIRHRQIGIEKYRWSTSKDSRVRPSHAALEGRVFPWSDPPQPMGHPGDDYQCRCAAIPVITKPLRKREEQRSPILERAPADMRQLSRAEVAELERWGYKLAEADAMAPPTDYQSLRAFLRSGHDRILNETQLVTEGFVDKSRLRKVFKLANQYWTDWDLDALLDENPWMSWMFRHLKREVLQHLLPDVAWGVANESVGHPTPIAVVRLAWEIFRGDPMRGSLQRFAVRHSEWAGRAIGRAAARHRLLERMGVRRPDLLFRGATPPPPAPKPGQTRAEWIQERTPVLAIITDGAYIQAELRAAAGHEYDKHFGLTYIGEPTFDGHTSREDWIKDRAREYVAHLLTVPRWRRRGARAIRREASRKARLEWVQGRWTGWRPSGVLNPDTPPPRTPTPAEARDPRIWIGRRMRELGRANNEFTERGAREHAEDEFAARLWEKYDPFVAAGKRALYNTTPPPKAGEGKADWIRKQAKVHREHDPQITTDESYLRGLRDWLRNQFEPPEPVIRARDDATIFVVRRTRQLHLFDPERFDDETARLHAWLEWRQMSASGNIPPATPRSPRADDFATRSQHTSTLRWERDLQERYKDELATPMDEEEITAFVHRLWRRHGKQEPMRITFTDAVDDRVVDIRGGDEIVFYLRSGKAGDAADTVRMTKAQVMHAVTSVLLDRADDIDDPVLRGETFASLMLRLYEAEVQEVADPASLARGVRFADDVENADWVRSQARASALTDWLVLHHSGDRPRVRYAGAPARKYAEEHRELPPGARGRRVGMSDADRPAGFRTDQTRMAGYYWVPLRDRHFATYGPISRARRKLSPDTPPPEDYVIPPVWLDREPKRQGTYRRNVRWLHPHERPEVWLERRAGVIIAHNPKLSEAEALDEAMLEWGDLFSAEFARVRPGDLYDMLNPGTPPPRFPGYKDAEGEAPFMPWFGEVLREDELYGLVEGEEPYALFTIFIAYRADELMRWNPLFSRAAAEQIAELEIGIYQDMITAGWSTRRGAFRASGYQVYSYRGGPPVHMQARQRYDAPDRLRASGVPLPLGDVLQQPSVRANDRPERWIPNRVEELMAEIAGLRRGTAVEWANAEWRYFSAQQGFLDESDTLVHTLFNGSTDDREKDLFRLYRELIAEATDGLRDSPYLSERQIRRFVRRVWRRHGISTPPELFFRPATASEAEEGLEAVFHRGAIHFLGDWEDEIPHTVPRYVVLHEIAHALHQRMLASTDDMPQGWLDKVGFANVSGPNSFQAQQHNDLYVALVIALLERYEDVHVGRVPSSLRPGRLTALVGPAQRDFDVPDISLATVRDNARRRGMSDESIMRGVDDKPVVYRGVPDDLRERIYGRDRSQLIPPAKPEYDQYGLKHDTSGYMYIEAYGMRDLERFLPRIVRDSLWKLETAWGEDVERYTNMPRHLERMEDLVRQYVPDLDPDILRRALMIRLSERGGRLATVPEVALSLHTPVPIAPWSLEDAALLRLWRGRRNLEVVYANPFMSQELTTLRAEDELDKLKDLLIATRKDPDDMFEFKPMPEAPFLNDGDGFDEYATVRAGQILQADESESLNGARMIATYEYRQRLKQVTEEEDWVSDPHFYGLPYLPLDNPPGTASYDHAHSYYGFEAYLTERKLLRDERVSHDEAVAFLNKMWEEDGAGAPLHFYTRAPSPKEREQGLEAVYIRGAVHYVWGMQGKTIEELRESSFSKRLLIHEFIHGLSIRAAKANPADPDDLGAGVSATEAALDRMIDHTPEYVGLVLQMFMKQGILKKMDIDELRGVVDAYNRMLWERGRRAPALQMSDFVTDTGWARRNMRYSGYPEEKILEGVDQGVLATFSTTPGRTATGMRMEHLDDVLNLTPEELAYHEAFPSQNLDDLPALLKQEVPDHLASTMDADVSRTTDLVTRSAELSLQETYTLMPDMEGNAPLFAPLSMSSLEWITLRVDQWLKRHLATTMLGGVDTSAMETPDLLSLAALTMTQQDLQVLMSRLLDGAAIEFAKFHSHKVAPDQLAPMLKEALDEATASNLPAMAKQTTLHVGSPELQIDTDRAKWVGLAFQAIIDRELDVPMNRGALWRALESLWISQLREILSHPGTGGMENTLGTSEHRLGNFRQLVELTRPPKVPPWSMGGFDKFDRELHDPLNTFRSRLALYNKLNPPEEVMNAYERNYWAASLEFRINVLDGLHSEDMHLLLGDFATPRLTGDDVAQRFLLGYRGQLAREGMRDFMDDQAMMMGLNWRLGMLEDNPDVQYAWADRGRGEVHMGNVYTFEQTVAARMEQLNPDLGKPDDIWVSDEEAVDLHNRLWEAGSAYEKPDIEFRPSFGDVVERGEQFAYTIQGRLIVFVYDANKEPPEGLSPERIAANKTGIWVRRFVVRHETAHAAVHRYAHATRDNPFGNVDPSRWGLVQTSLFDHSETYEAVKWTYWNYDLGVDVFTPRWAEEMSKSVFQQLEDQGATFDNKDLFANADVTDIDWVRRGVAERTGDSIEYIAERSRRPGVVRYIDEPPHPRQREDTPFVSRTVNGSYKPHHRYSDKTKPTPRFRADKDDPRQWVADRQSHLAATDGDLDDASARLSAMREFAEEHSEKLTAAMLEELVPKALRSWRYVELPGMAYEGNKAVWLAQHAAEIASAVPMLSEQAAIKAATRLLHGPERRRRIRKRDLPVPKRDLPEDEALTDLAEQWQRLVPVLDDSRAHFIARAQLDEAEDWVRRDRGFGRGIYDESHVGFRNEVRYAVWEQFVESVSFDSRGWGGNMNDDLTPRQAVWFVRALWRRYGMGKPPRLVFRGKGGLSSYDQGGMTILGREIHFYMDEDLYRRSGAIVKAHTVVHEVAHAIMHHSFSGTAGRPLGNMFDESIGHSESFTAFASVLFKEVFGIDVDRLRKYGADVHWNSDIATGQWARKNLFAKGVTAEEMYEGINDMPEIYFSDALDPRHGVPAGADLRYEDLFRRYQDVADDLPDEDLPPEMLSHLEAFRRGESTPLPDYQRLGDGPYKPHGAYEEVPEAPAFDRAQDDPRDWIAKRAEQLHVWEPDLDAWEDARRSASREFAEKHSRDMRPDRLLEMLPESLRRFKYLQLPGMTAEQSLDIWAAQNAVDIARELEWVDDVAAARVAQYMREQAQSGRATRYVPDVPMPVSGDETIAELRMRWEEYMPVLDQHTAYYIAAMHKSRTRGWRGDRGFRRSQRDERYFNDAQRDALYDWEYRYPRAWLQRNARFHVEQWLVKRGYSVDALEPTTHERVTRLLDDIFEQWDLVEAEDEAFESAEVLLALLNAQSIAGDAPRITIDELREMLRTVADDVWRLSANETVDFVRRVWRRAGLGAPPRIIFRRTRSRLERTAAAITFFGDEIHVLVSVSEDELHRGARVVNYLDLLHELGHIIAFRGLEGLPGDIAASTRGRHLVGHTETFGSIVRALYHEILGVPMEEMLVGAEWDQLPRLSRLDAPRFNEDVQTLQWARLNALSKGVSPEEVYGDVNAPLEFYFFDDLGPAFEGSVVRHFDEAPPGGWMWDVRQRFWSLRGVVRNVRHGGLRGHSIRKKRAADGPYKAPHTFSVATPAPPPFDAETGDPLQWIADRAPQIREGNNDVTDDDMAWMSAARDFAELHSERIEGQRLAAMVAGELEYILPGLVLPHGAKDRVGLRRTYGADRRVFLPFYTAMIQSGVPWVSREAAAEAADWLVDVTGMMRRGKVPEETQGSLRPEQFKVLETIKRRRMRKPVFKPTDRYESWVEDRADKWQGLIPTLHRQQARHFAGVEWADNHPGDAVDRGFGRGQADETETGYGHMISYYGWEGELDDSYDAWRLPDHVPGRWTPDELVWAYRWLWGHIEGVPLDETAGAGGMPRIVFRPPGRSKQEADDTAVTFGGEEIHFLIDPKRLGDPKKPWRQREILVEEKPGVRTTKYVDERPDGRVILATTALHELAHLLAWRALTGKEGLIRGITERAYGDSWGHEETFAALAKLFHKRILGLLESGAREAAEGRSLTFNEDVQTLQWVRRNLMSVGASPDEIYGALKDDFDIWYDHRFHEAFAPNQPGGRLMDTKMEQYRYTQSGPRWRQRSMPRVQDGVYMDSTDGIPRGAEVAEPFDVLKGDPDERIRYRMHVLRPVLRAEDDDRPPGPQLLPDDDPLFGVATPAEVMPDADEDFLYRTAAREFAEDWSDDIPTERLVELLRTRMRTPARTLIPGMNDEAAAQVWILQTASEIAADVIWVSEQSAVRAATHMRTSGLVLPARELPDRVVGIGADRDEWIADRTGDWMGHYSTMDEYTAMHVAASEWAQRHPGDLVDRGFGRTIMDEEKWAGVHATRYHEVEAIVRNAKEAWVKGSPMGGRQLTPLESMAFVSYLWFGEKGFDGVGAGRKPRMVFRPAVTPDEQPGDMFAVAGREIHIVLPDVADPSAEFLLDPFTLVHEVAHILAWRTLMGRPGNILGDIQKGRNWRKPNHPETFAGLVSVMAQEYLGLILPKLDEVFEGLRTSPRGPQNRNYWRTATNPDVVTGEWARRNLLSRGLTPEELFEGFDERLEVYFDTELYGYSFKGFGDAGIQSVETYDFEDIEIAKRYGLMRASEHRSSTQGPRSLADSMPARIGTAEVYGEYLGEHALGLPIRTGMRRQESPSTAAMLQYDSGEGSLPPMLPFKARYLPLVANDSDFYASATDYVGQRSGLTATSYSNWMLRVTTDTDGSSRDVLSAREVSEFFTNPQAIDFNSANNPTGKVVVDELQVPQNTLNRGYTFEADGNISGLRLPNGIKARLLTEYRSTPDSRIHLYSVRKYGEPHFEMDDPERTFTADIYRIWVVDESPTLTEGDRPVPLPSGIKGVGKEEWLAQRRREREFAAERLPELDTNSRWQKWHGAHIARMAEREYELIRARTITNTIEPDDSWAKLGMQRRPYPMRELFRHENPLGAKPTHKDLDVGEGANMLSRTEYGEPPTLIGIGSREPGDLKTWSRVFKLLVRDIDEGRLRLYQPGQERPFGSDAKGLLLPANNYDMSALKKYHHLGAGLGEYLRDAMESDLPVYRLRQEDLFEDRLSITARDGNAWITDNEGNEIQITEGGKLLKLTDEERELVLEAEMLERDRLAGYHEVEDEWDNHLRAAWGGYDALSMLFRRQNDVFDDVEEIAANWVFGYAFDWIHQLMAVAAVKSTNARSHSRMIHGASPHRNTSGIVTFRGWSAYENRWKLYVPESANHAREPITSTNYDASSYDINITFPFFQEGFGPGHAVMVETHMPYGTVGLHVGPGQLEYVLPPGTRWRYMYGEDNVVMTDSDYAIANPMFGFSKVVYREVEPFALYGSAKPVPRPLKPAELERYLDGLHLDDDGAVVTLDHDVVAYMFTGLENMHGVEFSLIPQARIDHRSFQEARRLTGASLDMNSTPLGAVYEGTEDILKLEVPVMMEVHIPKGSRLRIMPNRDGEAGGYRLVPIPTVLDLPAVTWSLDAIELLYGDRVPDDLHALYGQLLDGAKIDRLYRVRYVDLYDLESWK